MIKLTALKKGENHAEAANLPRDTFILLNDGAIGARGKPVDIDG